MAEMLDGMYVSGMTWNTQRFLLEEDSSETELIQAGIVPEMLEYMRDEDRRRILLKAGLEPKAFDF